VAERHPVASPRVLLGIVLLTTAFGRVALASPAYELVPESAGPGLRLRGGVRVRPDGREVYGLVTLSLPLEAMAAALGGERQAHGRPGGAPPALAQGPEPIPESPPATPPPLPPPPPVRAELSAQLVRDTVRVALRVAGLPGSRARLESLGSRMRIAPLVPDLRVRGGRTTDESLRLTPTDSDPYRYTQAGGTRLYLELELGWKLGRLVFDDAELRMEELWRQRAKAEREVVEQVLGALLEWQKARLRRTDPSLPADERLDAWLSMVRAASELDLLTNGWFERRMRATFEPL
jgi:hypothetical protein